MSDILNNNDYTLLFAFAISILYVIVKMVLEVLSEISIKNGMTPQEAKEKYDFTLKGIKRRRAKKQLEEQEERNMEEVNESEENQDCEDSCVSSLFQSKDRRN